MLNSKEYIFSKAYKNTSEFMCRIAEKTLLHNNAIVNGIV